MAVGLTVTSRLWTSDFVIGWMGGGGGGLSLDKSR